MKVKISLVLLSSLFFSGIIANDVSVNEWLDSGPLQVHAPGFIKGTNIQSEDFGPRYILSNTYLDLATLQPADGVPFLWDNQEVQNWMLNRIPEGEFLEIKPIRKAEYQIAYLAFYIESGGLNKHEMEVESPQMFEVFLQGKKLSSSYEPAGKDSSNTGKATLDLDRGKFLVIVKSLYTRGDENKWWIKAKVAGKPVLGTTPVCGMNIHHLLEGTKLGSVSISADGSLVMVNYSRVDRKSGENSKWTEIKAVSSGSIMQSFRKAGTMGYHWMPSGKKLYYIKPGEKGSSVWIYDFEEGKEYPVLKDIEELSGTEWSPDEKFLIYTISEKKKADSGSSLRYMDELGNRTFPDRSIGSLYKHDVASKVSTRLTYGEYSTWLNDISQDGEKIVFSVTRPNPTVRPFNQQDVYLMDLKTGKVDTLWKDSPWSGTAIFSPDGTKLLVSGGPDLFGETGRRIGDNPMANNYDTQAYLYDLSTCEVDPITMEFDPSVTSVT
ncbi:MAG: hypothetical protein KAT31_09670 [Bacteroidales bacterium]|nr:hypothetical protein [Bacteroidales bacterium]